jgi:hypothetical protein
MNKFFYGNIFVGLSLLSCSLNAIDQQKQVTMQMYNLLKDYPNNQDVIINNKVVKKGICDCEQRYQIIKTILDQYKRPITVLDLGAKLGYYSFRIAHDYPDSTCVMTEGSYKEPQLVGQLLSLCKLNTNLNNIILLKNKIFQEDFTRLADCEHFDVVLAFDFVSDNDLTWKKKIDTILRLGDNVLIQTSNDSLSKNENINEIDAYLYQKNGNVIFQSNCEVDPKKQNKIYWFACQKTGLRSKRFERRARDSFMNIFRIDSNYDHKYLFKKGSSHPINWKKGMNLVTFLMLNGVYPTKSHIKKEIQKSTNERLSDFAPWNIIVQGKTIRLIDQNDPGFIVDVEKCLDFIFKVIDQDNQDGVKKLFKKFGTLHLRHHKYPFKNFLHGL